MQDSILLIRLKSIGDVVLTLPAVHAVRENFPSAKITFLTSKENAPLLCGFRDVDEVITINRDAFRSGNPLKMASEFFALLRRLRAGKFSLVVDFQGYGETAGFTWITGASQRWGRIHRPGRAWAYTRGLGGDDDLHLADWNLSLLQQCGLKIGGIKNKFILPEDAMDRARRFLLTQKLDVLKPTLFIQPFTSSPQKNWPLENFLILARHFQSQGIQIIFGGGPSDCAALAPARRAGFIVAAGEPLLVSAGLMQLSTIVVGGVTGLLHLAVAMQRRVVMLVGHAKEAGFPYQYREWGLTPADGHLVSDIQIPAVIGACSKAFSESTCGISG